MPSSEVIFEVIPWSLYKFGFLCSFVRFPQIFSIRDIFSLRRLKLPGVFPHDFVELSGK